MGISRLLATKVPNMQATFTLLLGAMTLLSTGALAAPIEDGKYYSPPSTAVVIPRRKLRKLTASPGKAIPVAAVVDNRAIAALDHWLGGCTPVKFTDPYKKKDAAKADEDEE